MAEKWMQNPAIDGDRGKRYVTGEKAVVLANSGWTETTAPAGGAAIEADDIITRSEMVAYVTENGGGGGTVPDGTDSVKGKVLVPAGTADNPLYPASRIFGQVQDLQITDAIARTSALAGKADLDGSGKVPQAQLPAVALTDFLGAVANQAAMLALTGQRGDWCTRTDRGTDWQLVADTPGTLASWREMTYPASPVSSVAGRTGAVTLSKTDVGLGNVDNTADTAKPVSTAQQAALDAKATTSALTTHTGSTANPHSVTKTQVGLGSVDNVSAANLRDRATHTGSQTSTTISDFTEAVQDAVAALLGAGSNVILNYDDAANTLTVSATGAGGTGLDAEQARDAIGVALVGAGNISVVVNDAADTITITTTATANATDAALRDRSTHTGAQAISTVTGLQSALDAKTAVTVDGVFAASYDIDTTPVTYADIAGTVPTSALPPLAINETFVAASQAAMLALTAQRGDMAIRTDLTPNRTFVLASDSPSTLADWKEILAAGQVTSVAGKSGTVTLAKGDVGLGNVDNTSDTGKPISAATQTALDAKAATTDGRFSQVVANTQTGTAYTLVLADAGKAVEMNNAAANTLTVPPNSSVAFPVGTVLEVHQYGAGQTTVAAGAGVTLRAPDGAKLAKQYASASLRKRGTDEWVLAGSVTT